MKTLTSELTHTKVLRKCYPSHTMPRLWTCVALGAYLLARASAQVLDDVVTSADYYYDYDEVDEPPERARAPTPSPASPPATPPTPNPPSPPAGPHPPVVTPWGHDRWMRTRRRRRWVRSGRCRGWRRGRRRRSPRAFGWLVHLVVIVIVVGGGHDIVEYLRARAGEQIRAQRDARPQARHSVRGVTLTKDLRMSKF